MILTRGKRVCLFVGFLLVIDQIIKFVVKLNMTIGEEIPVFGDWFKILFIENNGMAFGMQLGGAFGKLLLTLFRVFLVAFIIYYIKRLLKQKETPVSFLVGLSLVLAGAIGNIVDSIFYGVVFSESTYSTVAQFMGDAGGYAPLLFGKVVDMFYFPIIDTTWPNWVPIWGGERFIFFSPIFNFADSCVSVGVASLLIFNRNQFKF